MMTRIGIFGTSGHAREVGDIAYALGFNALYVARDQVELDAWDFPGDAILESDVERYRDTDFSIGIGDNRIRHNIAKRYAKKLRFVNLIHPSATFGRGQRQVIENRQGVVICAGVRFTNNIQIGDFGIFNQNATVAHDVILDECVNLAPGANISGNVHIGARCWIGTGAAINQGTGDDKLRIGNDTIIGSGSVVVKSCDSNAVYVGSPARRIK